MKIILYLFFLKTKQWDIMTFMDLEVRRAENEDILRNMLTTAIF